MLTLDPSLNMSYCAKKKKKKMSNFLPSFKQLQKMVTVMVGENHQILQNVILTSFWEIKCQAESLEIA